MARLNAKQSAGWGHPAYNDSVLGLVGQVTSPGERCVGRVAPPGGASVKYSG
jgi:hypothetical protein